MKIKNQLFCFQTVFFVLYSLVSGTFVYAEDIQAVSMLSDLITESQKFKPYYKLRPPTSTPTPPVAVVVVSEDPVVVTPQPSSIKVDEHQDAEMEQVAQAAVEEAAAAIPAEPEPDTEWCLMFYIQASNNLSKFAQYNLQAMAEIGSRYNFHIAVQWHQPRQQGIWRYRVEKGKIDLKYSDEQAQTYDCAKNLIDFVDWSVKNYPAKKYALVLWNHGVGILDPVWGNPMHVNISEGSNPRIEIDGITVNQRALESFIQGELTKSGGRVFDAADSLSGHEKDMMLHEQMQFALNILSSENRGLLFDEYNHTYLNNQRMVYALRCIKEGPLKGKKLNLLGVDACLMAMAEVMLQVKDYADIFVASQEVELAQGWDYQGFLRPMIYNNVTPDELAKNIVQTFGDLYRGRTQLFTQSAIKLSAIKSIYENIDQVAAAYKVCFAANGQLFKTAIKRARASCLQYSTPTYIDLHSLYTEIIVQIDGLLGSMSKLGDSHCLRTLRALLVTGMELITGSVVANTASSSLARSQGISIYYPRYFIDASYPKTEFAQANQWLEFLALNLEH